MRRNTPTRTCFSILAALSLTIVSCSGGDDDDDTTTPDSGTQTTADAGNQTPRDGGVVQMDGGEVDPVLVSIAADPASITVNVGATQALTVTGTFDDGSSSVLTENLTFTSDDDGIATVAAGVVTGVAAGATDITVASGTIETTVAVTVNAVFDGLVVFDDDFGADVSFLEFGGSTNSFMVDTTNPQSGTASLRVEVPAAGYTGGALAIATPQDLSQFDALTFWARASADLNFNVTGIGNDAATSVFQAELNAVPLTSTWTRYVIPIPDASKLTAEAGLFHFAEGSEDGAYTVWFDNIQYETIGAAIESSAPAIATETISIEIGASFMVNGTSATYQVEANPVTINVARSYFEFASDDIAVATVAADGTGVGVGAGTAEIRGSLAGNNAAGVLTVNVSEPTMPTAAATAPTLPAANVISLFSGPYTDVMVDTFSAVWDNADVADVQVDGDDTKLYTNLAFAGVEFTTNTVDASAMTHFHMDIWTPNSTVFRVKLVDFGADNMFGGGDDTEHELTYDAGSTPPLMTGSWMQLEIPFTDFVNLTNRSNLAQMIIVGSTSTVYVDNVYFHN